jgi:hypothetical protein
MCALSCYHLFWFLYPCWCLCILCSANTKEHSVCAVHKEFTGDRGTVPTVCYKYPAVTSTSLQAFIYTNLFIIFRFGTYKTEHTRCCKKASLKPIWSLFRFLDFPTFPVSQMTVNHHKTFITRNRGLLSCIQKNKIIPPPLCSVGCRILLKKNLNMDLQQYPQQCCWSTSLMLWDNVTRLGYCLLYSEAFNFAFELGLAIMNGYKWIQGIRVGMPWTRSMDEAGLL